MKTLVIGGEVWVECSNDSPGCVSKCVFLGCYKLYMVLEVSPNCLNQLA
jgi:hypothetical protein